MPINADIPMTLLTLLPTLGNDLDSNTGGAGGATGAGGGGVVATGTTGVLKLTELVHV